MQRSADINRRAPSDLSYPQEGDEAAPVIFLSRRILGCRSHSLFAGPSPSDAGPWLLPMPAAVGSGITSWEAVLCAPQEGYMADWQDVKLGGWVNGWYSTVFVLRNIPGSLSRLLSCCMRAPPRTMRSCNSHATLGQQVHMAAVGHSGREGNDRSCQAFSVVRYSRCVVDQELACSVPCTSKKLVAGMPQATLGTRCHM